MLSSLDFIIIIAALALMTTGFLRRYRMWKQGQPERTFENRSSNGGWRLFLSILRHKSSPDNPYGNLAHLFIFLGFMTPFIVVVASQFRPVVPSWLGHSLSILLDIIGLLAIAGTGLLISKRMFRNGGAKGCSIYLWILLAVLITGFIAEGLRMTMTRDLMGGIDAIFSPVGFVFSWVLPDSSVLLKVFVRIHFFMVLLFIACIPFSNMRHAFASLFSVYYQKIRPEGRICTIDLQGDYFGLGAVNDFSWMQLLDSDACMNCGRCDSNCPANISGKPLMPNGVIRELGRQMEKSFAMKSGGNDNRISILGKDGLIGKEDIWACTTCLACVKSCPVFARHLNDIIGLRRYSVLTESKFPSEYKKIFKNIEIFGDPYGAGSPMREEWAAGLNPVRVYEKENIEFLLWVGCTGALYDEGSRGKVLEMALVLNRAGVNFGILGKFEACCGDGARRLGNEYLFQRLVYRNIDTMNAYGIKKIITSCPHCFNVLKNEYPELGGDFEVIHITQLLRDLIKEGRLKIKSRSSSLLTYHDPCYLGRYNGIQSEPRDILGLLLNANMKEMDLSGDRSFCCGAGGGNFWCGRTMGRRMEELRVEQAIETGVEGLVTTCPFCEILFDSAIRQRDTVHSFEVMDIVQLVNRLTE